MKTKLLSLLTFMGVSSIGLSQTARVQAIHNSADLAADTVDVWLTTGLGSTKLIEDFAFRTATPFIDAPAGTPIKLSIAPKTSTAITDTITGLSFDYVLSNATTYVIVADGLVSGSGYNPLQPFDLKVYNMGRETASSTGNTDVLVHHGSTDAPTVDIDERTAGNLVDDASYGDFAGYLSLPTADYTLDIKDATGSVVVASYSAPLATLGLADSAITVVASGFLDPSQNSGGEAFGLWVALPEGGNLIPLPSATGPTARLQVIHNSADLAADSVDVYLNGTLLLDNFAFRTATPFIDVDALTPLEIGIAPKTSTSVNDTITGAVFNYILEQDSTYVIIADGIVSGSGYTPSQPFDLKVYNMGREMASSTGNTDVLVHHGSTDAPTVDVDERTAGNLVDDASYGDFAGYLSLTTADYILDIKDATGITTLFSYDAPLATLGLTDSAIVVIASGFVNPANNSNGESFGLWVALAEGGDLIPLPVNATTSLTELNNVELTIYPNPTVNSFTISGLDEQFNISILSNDGKIVKTINATNPNEVISIEELDKGNYQLIISNLDGKLIKTTSLIRF